MSSRWWYGVAGGSAAWVLALAPLDALDAAGFGAVSTGIAVLALLAWPAVPGFLYLDRRATADAAAWAPRTRLWLAAAALPVAGAAAGTAYCLRRASALRGGVPSAAWRPLAYAGLAGWAGLVAVDVADPSLGAAGDVLFGPVLWLVALGTPVAVSLDAVRARAYTDLAPNLPALVALVAVPLVNLPVGAVYVAGREYHRRAADADAEPDLPGDGAGGVGGEASADGDGRAERVSPWYRRAVAVYAAFVVVGVGVGAAAPSLSAGALELAAVVVWPPFGLAFVACYHRDRRALAAAGFEWGPLARYGFYLSAPLAAVAFWYLLVRYTSVERARREGRLDHDDGPGRGETTDHRPGELPRVGAADVDSSVRPDAAGPDRSTGGDASTRSGPEGDGAEGDAGADGSSGDGVSGGVEPPADAAGGADPPAGATDDEPGPGESGFVWGEPPDGE